jgi:integrative and conjugative element protein (TIGR02256 family)
MNMTNGQRRALEQMQEVAAASGGLMEVVSVEPVKEDSEFVALEFSLYCGNLEKAAGGLPLRERERFTLLVPPDFPFKAPSVNVKHTRFAGFPHVQWRHHLCVYQAPATEWDPSDGLFGLLDRLNLWLRQGAVGQLDPIGGPLHQPVTYVPSGPVRTVVPRVNTPEVGQEDWFGTAHLQVVSDRRVDIVGWSEFLAGDTPRGVGAAILLATPMPFEFPQKVADLLEALAERGVRRDRVFLTLQGALINNEENDPLYVILGAPMRGIRGSELLQQHLTAWYVDPVIVRGLRLALNKYSNHRELQEIGEEVEQVVTDWAKEASVEWCVVREDRPEIVTRRDHAAPLAWVSGRVVSLWGCGALGGYVAEFLARAGVRRLILRDKGLVGPGLIARQPFDDQDIGRPKVHALRDHLRRIRPGLEVEVHARDILEEPLGAAKWTDGAELVIDTAASNAVLGKLELCRRLKVDSRVPVISMVIGHKADRGLIVFAGAAHSGGPMDVCRRAKLEVCRRAILQPYADEFWPEQRHPVFQPEPGCSENTFVGSAADTAALAGMMLNRIALDLAGLAAGITATAHFVAQPHAQLPGELSAGSSFCWEPDRISQDPQAGYETRIAESVWCDMLAWVSRSRRLVGPAVETGGLLFGERDDAVGVVWVSEVIGPPPDSQASAAGFLCGVSGTGEANREKQARTRGSAQYIGMWHTHPESLPLPSTTDLEGMERLVSATGHFPAKTLLLIIGSAHSMPTIGTFVFSRSDFPGQAGGFMVRACSVRALPARPKPRRIGLCLSGGGSRAIAFHLGCLRGMHHRGLLQQVEVISAVSGGAVIAAMYGYGNDTFADFERRVSELLRGGLARGIARRALLSLRLVGSLGTAASSGLTAVGADLLRVVMATLAGATGWRSGKGVDWIDRIQPPWRRWFSRTDAFEGTLGDLLFGKKLLTDPRRDGIHVVLNACELRTGTAFRFGSKESGSWRFGRVRGNEISVAQAVAASAAYPAFLPAMDRRFMFVARDGRERRERVILTDGGVFDNLGTTCLEPGRSEDFSTNVFCPEYIVCCDAGPGQFSDHVRPYWWPTRMKRSFEAVYRKVLSGSYQRLHQHATSGALKGFVLAYLGQQDKSLPYMPADLVPREDVASYPTDFSSMSDSDLELIASRGEQLTRLLVSHYCPEL